MQASARPQRSSRNSRAAPACSPIPQRRNLCRCRVRLEPTSPVRLNRGVRKLFTDTRSIPRGHRRRRTPGDQAVPRDPRRQPALAVRLRTRPAHERQAVNYLSAEPASAPISDGCGPTCCAIARVTPSVTRVTTSGCCRTSWATEIRGTRHGTLGLPVGGLKGCGSNSRELPNPTSTERSAQPATLEHSARAKAGV